MTLLHDADGPTPEFRARLEWQIETALRRETRFNEPVRQRLSRLRTALITAAALVIGGIGGLMPGYAQESRERQELLEGARQQELLTQVRLELVRAEVDAARRRFETGVADRQILIALEDQLRAREAELARLRLDMEEIRATAAQPRNDLLAPLIAKRDFVRERLMLDLSTAQRALVAAEAQAARAKQRVDVGLAPPTEMQQADVDLAKTRARMQMLGAMLEYRRRALEGSVKAEDVAPTLRRLELTQSLQQLQLGLDLAQARLELAKRRFSVGTASELDVKQAELQILEQQLEMKRLQQQLQALGARK